MAGQTETEILIRLAEREGSTAFDASRASGMGLHGARSRLRDLKRRRLITGRLSDVVLPYRACGLTDKGLADAGVMVLTGRQVREGRELVRLSQSDLAAAADVALALVVRVEAIDGMAMMRKPDAVAVRAVLEDAGVEFIVDGCGGSGVRLLKVDPA